MTTLRKLRRTLKDKLEKEEPKTKNHTTKNWQNKKPPFYNPIQELKKQQKINYRDGKKYRTRIYERKTFG